MTHPIDRAAEVLARWHMGMTTQTAMLQQAQMLHDAGLLVTPAHDAAVAAKALRDAADARSEWQAELDRQDDRHFASGSMHGAGPDVACDVFEAFLTDRADRIEREGGSDV